MWFPNATAVAEAAAPVRTISLPCGADLEYLAPGTDYTSEELHLLRRKYSSVLISFDRCHSHFLHADTTDRPTDGAMNIRELVGHMVEFDNEVWHPRIRAIISEEHPFLRSIERQELVDRCDWNTVPIEKSITRFMQSRWACSKWINELPESAFTRKGIHEEYGELTIGNILQLLVGHDMHTMEVLRKRLNMPEPC